MQKGVYHYEYMDHWEKFNKTPEKEDFYSHLNMEDITNTDSDFEIKNFRRIS